MTPEPAFRAPWSRPLISTTIAVTAICFTCALIPLLAQPDGVSMNIDDRMHRGCIPFDGFDPEPPNR